MPPEAASVVPALRDSISIRKTPPNHAIRHESLEDNERTIFANHISVQPHRGIGHPTKAGLPTDVKAKKEMQIRRPANHEFARCHLEAARGPQPERLLQSRRRIISCEKQNPYRVAKPSKTLILNFSTTHLDRNLERILFSLPPLLHEYRDPGDGGGHRGPRGGGQAQPPMQIWPVSGLSEIFHFFSSKIAI